MPTGMGSLVVATAYANLLVDLKRFEEAKSLLLKATPLARRVFGESHELTLKMRWIYAQTLYADVAATVDDLREAVLTVEDTARITRRVFGGAHPYAVQMERSLRQARLLLRARETEA